MKLHNNPVSSRWLRLLTATSLVVGVAIAGSAGAASAATAQPVTILESTPGFFDLPIHVAADDFGAKNGVDIKLIQVQGGGAAGQEFEGGTGDIAITAVDTALRLQMAHGISGGLSVIGSNQFTMLYVLTTKTGSSYTSPSQLTGKTIGIPGPLSAAQVTMSWVLQTKYHINPSSVKWVSLGSMPAILQATQKGTVDTGVLFSPALDQGLSAKSVKIVFDLRKYPYGQNVFYARNTQVKADPSKYSDFMKAYTAAVKKLESDPSFAFSEAKKYYGQGLSSSSLHTILNFYLKKEWAETQFTKASYAASKNVLLHADVGFSASTFPTLASITQDVPKS